MTSVWRSPWEAGGRVSRNPEFRLVPNDEASVPLSMSGELQSWLAAWGRVQVTFLFARDRCCGDRATGAEPSLRVGGAGPGLSCPYTLLCASSCRSLLFTASVGRTSGHFPGLLLTVLCTVSLIILAWISLRGAFRFHDQPLGGRALYPWCLLRACRAYASESGAQDSIRVMFSQTKCEVMLSLAFFQSAF